MEEVGMVMEEVETCRHMEMVEEICEDKVDVAMCVLPEICEDKVDVAMCVLLVVVETCKRNASLAKYASLVAISSL
ncbi:hypothetical protein HanXRQr2_Chr07g0305161 [Helianthus annuus]|uniref:Uncharacterized protein n=1 Tax=Helianthus annuus TaxID=4232 RepID=A0A9K3IM48_HELAN|nr:hypothetical protein HanXRQr2_Chr07g0305161 [Helianthus annuus]